MSFSVLDSLFLQRQILQGLSGQSNQWLEALNWPDEMRPEQWCQFQTAVQKTFVRTRELFSELSCVDVQFLLRDICDVRIQQPLDFTGGERLICEHFKAFRELKTALLSPSQKTSPPLFSLVEKATEPYRDIAESREKQKSALKQDFFRETGDRFLSSQTKEEFQLERGDAEDEFVMDSEALLPSALWAHRYSLAEAFHAWQPLYEALGKPLALSSEQWLYQEALVQKIQPQLILEIGRSALVSTVALLESAHRLPASCRLFSTSMEEVTEEEVYATLTALRPDSSWLEPLTLHQNALDLFAFDSLLDDTVQEVLLFWYAQDSVSIRSLLKDWLPALHRCRVTLVIKELRDLRFYSPQSGGHLERLHLGWMDIGKELALSLLSFVQEHSLELVSMAEEVQQAQERSCHWREGLLDTLGAELFNGVGDWVYCELPPWTLEAPVALEDELSKPSELLPLALWKHRHTLTTLEAHFHRQWPRFNHRFALDTALQWAALVLETNPRLLLELGRDSVEMSWFFAEIAQMLPETATVVSVDTEWTPEGSESWGEHWRGFVCPVEAVAWNELWPEEGDVFVLWRKTNHDFVRAMFSSLLPEWSASKLTLLLVGTSDLRFVEAHNNEDTTEPGGEIRAESFRVQSGFWEMPLSLLESWSGFCSKNNLELRSSAKELSLAKGQSPRWYRSLLATLKHETTLSTGSWGWLQSNARLRAFQSPTRPQKEETAPLLSTALWEQREVLTQALPRLERWREVLDDRCFEEFSPHQWVLLWAVIWDFQPDLVLQIGRGSGVMALAVQEAMLSIEGGHFVTVSTDDKLERFLLPKISPHLSDSWYEGFSLHVREPRTLPYERLLRGKERVLILWVSPEERDAELVMSSLLPAVAERSHLLALMNSGDLRFQSKEKSAEQASRKRGQERLLHLGHLCAPVAVATEILDFTTRNELVLDSGSQEILDFCDHYKLRSRELQERLGEPWFLRAGNWWWLSLSRQPQKTWQFTPNTYQFPHHPVFYELDPFRGEIPPDFLEDYVGTRVRYAFLQHKPPVRTGLHTYSDYPVMDEEYFEWIDILESVMNAGEQYVMIELGAGYGRWSARAAIAARRKGISAITLRPVEADPHHAQNLRQHFLDNGLKESEFDIVQAVVGAEESEVEFYIETSRHDDAGEEIIWYGQSKAQEHEEVARETKNKSYGGQPVLVYASGHQAIRIPQLPLSQILEGLGVVDLLDLDIQGEEWNVLSSSVELLNSQVKRIHIGTHGHELEISIRALLAQEGWICLADYPCHGTHSTPYGEIDFVDGVQSWLNPRFS